MSTTIFTGFRVPMTQMHEFTAFYNNAKALLEEKWLQDYCRDVAREATRVYDAYEMGFPYKDEVQPHSGGLVYTTSALRYVLSNEFTKNKDAERTIFGTKDAYLYLIPQPEYLIGLSNANWIYDELMASDLNVEDFGYWNNTDKPDEISEEEWEFREEVWNQLVGYGSPTDYALVMQISPEYPPILDHQRVDEFIPDFESRAKEMANMYKSTKMPKDVLEECSNTTSFMPFMRWMQSDEGKEYGKEGLAIAKSTLPKTVTGSDLDTKKVVQKCQMS